MDKVEWTIKKPFQDLEGFFVAPDKVFSNDFIKGLEKLHDLQRHIEAKGLLRVVA